MTTAGRAPPYAIVVTQHSGVYSLSIPELLLTVRARDLQDGYKRLLERQQEMFDLARSMDALDDLPPPAEFPALKPMLR